MQALVSHIQHVHADGAERGRADPGASELLNDGCGYEGDDGDSAESGVAPSSSSSSSSSRDSDPPSSASSTSSGGGAESDGSDNSESDESSSSSSLSESEPQGDQDPMPGPLHDRSDDDDANSSDECVYSVDEEAFPDIDQRITR